LANKAVSGDTVVYYHSSHGGNEDTTQAEVYLCTYDKDYQDRELAEDLALFKTGVELLVIVDACHSGGLFTDDASSQSISSSGGKAVPTAREAAARSASWDLAGRVTAIMKANRAAAAAKNARAAAKGIDADEIGWLTATAYYQYSYEQSDVGHGLFTYYLLEGISKGDADGDGSVDFAELFDFAACRVPYFDQIPQSAGADTLAAAIAASSGVSALPEGDAWDYADSRPELSPTELVPSSAGLDHGPHTLRELFDESDLFAFPVSALRTVSFSSSGGKALDAMVYDGNLMPVRYPVETGGGDFVLTYKPPADGIAYLQVSSSATNDAYTLHCVRSPGEDTFPTLYPPCSEDIGDLEEWEYLEWRVVVPEGCTSLSFSLAGDGDADLYLGDGFLPLDLATDYFSENSGSDESIAVSRPAAGEWFIQVYGYYASSNLVLTVSMNPEPTSVEMELADLVLADGVPTATVLHSDLRATPETLPIYFADNLLSRVWSFLTNAPFADGVVTLPPPDATGYYAIGDPTAE